jgi:hypothetical protein
MPSRRLAFARGSCFQRMEIRFRRMNRSSEPAQERPAVGVAYNKRQVDCRGSARRWRTNPSRSAARRRWTSAIGVYPASGFFGSGRVCTWPQRRHSNSGPPGAQAIMRTSHRGQGGRRRSRKSAAYANSSFTSTSEPFCWLTICRPRPCGPIAAQSLGEIHSLARGKRLFPDEIGRRS